MIFQYPKSLFCSYSSGLFEVVVNTMMPELEAKINFKEVDVCWWAIDGGFNVAELILKRPDHFAKARYYALT